MRLDRCGVGGANPPEHCSGSLPNLAQEGEAGTSGRYMSPGSRFGLMGYTEDARQTMQGDSIPRGLFQDAGSGTSTAAGRNWLFFAELDATRKPGRNGPGRGPGPAGQEETRGPGMAGRQAPWKWDPRPRVGGDRVQKSIPLVPCAWRGLQPLRPRPKHVRPDG